MRSLQSGLQVLLVALLLVAPTAAQALSPGLGPVHALAMHGEPKHDADFRHFDYANPDAPQGGRLVLGEVGTFDSLNPFIVLGRPMWHMRFPRRVFESLMVRSRDEPFTMYGLLAETVEVPDDRSWVAFTLREGVRFSDGSALTVEDVLFSYAVQREHGRFRSRYKKVVRAEQTGPRSVRFVFDPDIQDRELALLIGAMPVFSRAYYATRDFSKTTLEPPMGSGPYVIAAVDPGRSLTFRRNPAYWGAALAVQRGFNNFDEIRYDYYRDANAAFEAFKAGAVSVRVEPDSNLLRWYRGYDFAAARDGRVQRADLPPPRSIGMLGFAINTRRAHLSDVRVREALVRAFDFEWMNANYFFGGYERTRSFFPRSDLAAEGTASAAERTLLAAYPEAVTPDILEQGLVFETHEAYYTRTRIKLARAVALFEAAGYTLTDGVMTDTRTGTPFTFEIMIEHPDHQRVALAYADELSKIGVEARVRLVDSSQFQTRSRERDFDMMPFLWTRSFSPGVEQGFRWSSAAADQVGTFNFSGVKSEAADALIAQLVAARTRDGLQAAARALDRVLLSGHYVVPLYHARGDRVAWWGHLRRPERLSLTGYDLDTWWSEEGAAP